MLHVKFNDRHYSRESQKVCNVIVIDMDKYTKTSVVSAVAPIQLNSLVKKREHH